MDKDWKAVAIEAPNIYQFTSFKPHAVSTEVHVKPVDDLVLHVLVGLECMCGVIKNDAGIYVHNSWDNREEDE